MLSEAKHLELSVETLRFAQGDGPLGFLEKAIHDQAVRKMHG